MLDSRKTISGATLVAIWREIADRVSRRKSNREVSLQELSSLTDDVSGLLTGKRTYGYSGTALGKARNTSSLFSVANRMASLFSDGWDTVLPDCDHRATTAASLDCHPLLN